MRRFLTIIPAGLLLSSPALADQFELLTGVNVRNYPGPARVVVPVPGPGVPGTFSDGDRLAGTPEDGLVVLFQGLGTPFYEPNEFGSLSFMFRRGSIPLGPTGQLPFMGIDFLGGPRLDLDGDPNNGARSLVPVSGQTPVELPGITSFVELNFDIAAGNVTLVRLDATGTNEGGPGIQAEIATVLATIAGTDNSGSVSGPSINPGIDTRTGTLTAHAGSSGGLSGVYRIEDLGYEFWQDSIDPQSSTANELGTFQYLGSLRGWMVQRDPQTLSFPALAGEGLGTTLWPLVDTSQIGGTFNTANGLAGGSATIAGGSGGDAFSAPNNGGVPLADFGGDLGAYIDNVVAPQVPDWYFRFVYLESAGFGINNSGDPVYLDTIGYDVVLVGAARCPGDVNGDGSVTFQDLVALLASYGSSDGDPSFNPGADLNDDGTVDFGDLVELLGRYGSSCV